jgi:hypothetical protein
MHVSIGRAPGELVTSRRVRGLSFARCWFPASEEPVLAALEEHDVVTAVQCTGAVAERLRPLAFSSRPFVTTVVDLRLTDEELAARANRNCRRDLAWGGANEHEVVLNRDTDEARALIDAGIASKRYRSPLGDDEWGRLLEHADVVLMRRGGRSVAAHVVMPARRRAQLQLTATAEREAGADRDVGRLNRLLHWHELRHYRERGLAEYDFGGVVLDPAHALAGATRFKRSFGGELVTEHVVRVTRNRLLRAVLARAYRGDSGNPAMNAASG